jgi:hypothetical protein
MAASRRNPQVHGSRNTRTGGPKWRRRSLRDLSDRDNFASGYRSQSVQNDVYKRQQIFELVCPGTNRNDREFPPREILLIGYASIYGQENLIGSEFGVSQ